MAHEEAKEMEELRQFFRCLFSMLAKEDPAEFWRIVERTLPTAPDEASLFVMMEYQRLCWQENELDKYRARMKKEGLTEVQWVAKRLMEASRKLPPEHVKARLWVFGIAVESLLGGYTELCAYGPWMRSVLTEVADFYMDARSPSVATAIERLLREKFTGASVASGSEGIEAIERCAIDIRPFPERLLKILWIARVHAGGPARIRRDAELSLAGREAARASLSSNSSSGEEHCPGSRKPMT